MALPANIRVNVAVPFPAMVQGSSFITLGKTNGVWTIGASGAFIAVANPGVVATDYVIVWDDAAKGWIRISLSNLITQAVAVKPQRSVTASPIVVTAGPPADQILNVNIAAGAPTCTLPQASTRGGLPLTFKDVGGQFGAHPLTITAFAGDNIDGGGTLVLNVPRQGVTLVPGNDGINTLAWSIE
jgi:hypothetical protein